jgi:hypothetical protein
MVEAMSDWPFRMRLGLFVNRGLKAVGPDHIRAHKNCSRHRNEIESSQRCACFYCLQSFPPSEIVDWTDDDATAMCPRCGIDSVIGSASGFSLSPGFLQRMHNHWFERTYKIKL